MAILIEVLQSESNSLFFRVENGRTLGRSRADIVINDPNISGTHAKIDLDNKGQHILIDLESSNGLILGQKKVKKVALLPGVKFQIGKTHFIVREVTDDEADSLTPNLSWKEQIQRYFSKNQAPDKNFDLRAFTPIVELEFIKGVHAEEVLQLGYGPRLIGSSTWDVELKDLEIPEQAFELIPDGKDVKINNLCSQKLKLNKMAVTAKILESGDIIEVGSTTIRIHLKQDMHGNN